MARLQMEFYADVKGISDLKRRIRDAKAAGRKAIRKGSRVAGNILLKTMRGTTRFRDKTGNLRKSMVLRMLENKKERIMMQVVPRAPKGAHAHLVEYGHDIVRNGKIYGRVEGRAFMLQAFKDSAENAAQAGVSTIKIAMGV